MTKQEFLTELQKVLNGRMGSDKAAPHIAYYQEYIEIEMRKGRKEEEVIGGLGSPRLIGKNIVDVPEKKSRYAKALTYGAKMLEHGLKTEVKKWFDKL